MILHARALGAILTMVAGCTVVAASAIAEESVTLYTSVPTTIVTKLQKAFEAREKGIDLKVFRAGTGRIAAKIATERQAGGIDADVIWVADFAYYETLKAQKLLLKYDSPSGRELPPTMKDPDGYYYSARMIAMALGYNPTLVKDPPRRWTDLLDPSWRGKVVMSDPRESGAALDTVGALTMHYGLDYFQKLRANGAVVVRANNTVATEIAAGEFPVGIVLDYFVRSLHAKGSPIALVYPQDGAVAIPSPIAIIAGSKNVKASEKFVDYVLSKEGQATLRKVGYFIPVRSGMAPPKGAPTVKELDDDGLQVDWNYINRNTKWLIDRFTSIMLD